MVPLDLAELLAHKVSKVAPERQESPVPLDQWDLVDHLDLLENLEAMVRLANLENLVSVDLQGLRELVASPGLLDFLESKDTEVTMVWMELRERPVPQEPRVSPVPLERTAPLEPWAHVVFLVRGDVLERPELQVLVEMMACPVLLVHLGLLVLLELPVSQDLQDPREKLVLLEAVDLKEHRDLAERPVPQDPLDPPEHRATPVLMVFLELKDLLAVLVLLVLLDSPAPVAHLDHREPQDLWGQRDSLETLVLLDTKVKLDPRESLAPSVLSVDPVPLVKKESEAPEESLEVLDHSDLREREELPVTVVSQVRTVLLVLRVPPVTVVFLVLVGPKVSEEIQDAQESPASPEPEVSPVVPEMLVLKAKLEPQVLPVRTVAPAHPALWEPVDSPE